MEALAKLFIRDLDKLIQELNDFHEEQNMWIVQGNISNSAGNLALHIIGNLSHFIGTVIGGTDYQRRREEEFSKKHIPRSELIEMINQTKTTVNESLNKMDVDILKSTYPINVFGEEMTYEFFLLHLLGHLNYHLGQINYLRRIIDYNS